MKFQSFALWGLLVALVASGCARHLGHPPTPIYPLPATSEMRTLQMLPPSSPTEALYIHCIASGQKIDDPCIRLLTVRVRPSEEIEVFLPRTQRTPSLTGQIEVRGDKYFARLRGNFANNGLFEGEVELEKRFSPSGFIASGFISPFAFVLSRRSDPTDLLAEPFYKIGNSSGDKVDVKP